VSPDERPELRTLRELEDVADLVAGELSAFRARALKAEAACEELQAEADMIGSRTRIHDLESENQALHLRVDTARGRVEQLVRRLRFLEDQITSEQPGS